MKTKQVVFSMMTILSTLTASAANNTMAISCKGTVDSSVAVKGYIGSAYTSMAVRYTNENGNSARKTMTMALTAKPSAVSDNYSYTSNNGEDETNFEVRVRRGVFESGKEGTTEAIKFVVIPAYSGSEQPYDLTCKVEKVD